MHIQLILCIAIVFSMQYLPGAADDQEPYDIKKVFILTALNNLKEGNKEWHEDKVNQAAQWLAQFYLLQYQEEKQRAREETRSAAWIDDLTDKGQQWSCELEKQAHGEMLKPWKEKVDQHGLEQELAQRICAEILKGFKEVSVSACFSPSSRAITQMAYNNTGAKLALGFANGEVVEVSLDVDPTRYLTHFETCGKIKKNSHREQQITALCYTPKNKLISFGGGRVIIWPHCEHEENLEFELLDLGSLLGAGCTPQGDLVYARKKGLRKIIDIDERKPLQELAESITRIELDKEYEKACFSSDYRHVAMLTNTGVDIWNLGDMTRADSFTWHYPIDALCLHNEGELFVFACMVPEQDGECFKKVSKVWERNGKVSEYLTKLDGWMISGMRFNHNARQLTYYSRGDAYTFDRHQRQKPPVEVVSNEHTITAVAQSPTGQELAVADEAGKLRLRGWSHLASVDSIVEALEINDELSSVDT